MSWIALNLPIKLSHKLSARSKRSDVYLSSEIFKGGGSWQSLDLAHCITLKTCASVVAFLTRFLQYSLLAALTVALKKSRACAEFSDGEFINLRYLALHFSPQHGAAFPLAFEGFRPTAFKASPQASKRLAV